MYFKNSNSPKNQICICVSNIMYTNKILDKVKYYNNNHIYKTFSGRYLKIKS